MARIPLTLAAVTLAATLGGPLAHAQSSPAYPTPSVPSASGQPMAQPGSSAYQGMPSSQAPMYGRQGSAMQGSTSGMGSGYGSGISSSGMSGSDMMGDNRPTVPIPAQPFNNLNLPNQPQVGDGAYNGGGAVVEYLPDGSRRIVPR